MKILKKYCIKSPQLFKEVFTHKSCAENELNNERLEFIGDSVLSLVVSDFLMKKYPQDQEGALTKKRSQLVRGAHLAKIAEELNLQKDLKTSRDSYKKNPRILAGVLEAYIGAVYLESGMDLAEKFIHYLFKNKWNQNSSEWNYKSVLQEWCQKNYGSTPVYKIMKEEGLAHKKKFYVKVFIENKICGSGSSFQKKQAEQNSAQKAIKKLKIPFK